ncbi:hypothetical protein G4Y79_24375 [Phototrophicus methaneseepsis]|uniref:Phospholipase/carboxylesterase/thioesterase domain-containing protein n=1 Tax=Phototrophicus methaneseepsis TaxID=2710758 RepID=A0A7S8IFC1_9CHLR|nr:hypothetical protein [Phototrophicus methaneseepsis]QPC82783.1 hypothetical protein G4Y79_24375 [Phototrophicus methaneseepsis]
MNAEIVALIKSKDSERRKQGIMQAGRSKDPAYIPLLAKLVQIEPDLALRAFEEKTIAYLEHCAQVAQQATSRVAVQAAGAQQGQTGHNSTLKPLPKKQIVQPITPKSSTGQAKAGATKNTQPRQRGQRTAPDLNLTKIMREKEERKAYRKRQNKLALIGFTIVLLIAAFFIVFPRFVRSRSVLSGRMQLADRLNLEGHAPSFLLGGTYRDEMSNYMSYTVFEPYGPTPPGGWPVVVAVHGWGQDAFDIAAAHYSWTQEDGVLLVVPQFVNERVLSNDHEPAINHMNVMLETIEKYYDINVNAYVIYGFSWGASLTYDYTSRYPLMFGGAVCANMYYTTLPPTVSEVKYALFAGEDEDIISEVVRQVAGAMERRGTPLWYWEITNNRGHEIASIQVAKTRELMRLLRAEAT